MLRSMACYTFAALFCVVEVHAQTTTCMAMGNNMVDCNTMTSRGNINTNCMSMGGGMVNCHSLDMQNAASSPDGGAVLGQAIGGLIRRIGEKNFRKKIGAMIADGDCQGAARYALTKGRLELGSTLMQACTPNYSAAPRQATPSARTVDPHTAVEKLGRELINVFSGRSSVHPAEI